MQLKQQDSDTRSPPILRTEETLLLENLQEGDFEKEVCRRGPEGMDSTARSKAACGSFLAADACSPRDVIGMPTVATRGRSERRSVRIPQGSEGHIRSAHDEVFSRPLPSAPRTFARADNSKTREHTRIGNGIASSSWPSPTLSDVSSSSAIPSSPPLCTVSVASSCDSCTPGQAVVDSMSAHQMTSLRDLELSSVARTSADSQFNHSAPLAPPSDYPFAPAAAAFPTWRKPAARELRTQGYGRAGECSHAPVAAAADGKASGGTHALASLHHRAESRDHLHCSTTRKAPGARRRRKRLLPQGFSLAHIPVGFLWCRPRVGALRLVYKKAGNPDYLLVIGPNWNFAVAMFFLHVAGITFFIYLFDKELKEDFWLFAAGVGLCLATFASFLCTVFKDPGLPLANSSANMQRQRLKPMAVGTHARERLSRTLYQPIPRLQREYRRLAEAKKTLFRKLRSAPITRLVDKRELQQHALSYTERENAFCRIYHIERHSPDDCGCRCRGGPHTLLSKTLGERERYRKPSRNGPGSNNSGYSCESNSEHSCVTDRSRGSISANSSDSSNSDGSADTRLSSDMRDSGSLTEVTPDTCRPMDGPGVVHTIPSCPSKEYSEGEKRACNRRNERLTRQACSTNRLPHRSARLKRSRHIPSTLYVRSLRGQNPPQVGTSSPTIIGNTVGDRQDVFIYSREEEAETSVVSLLNSPRKSAVKVSVHSLYGAEKPIARRGYQIKPSDDHDAPGAQHVSDNDMRFDIPLEATHPRGASADALSLEASRLAHFFPLRSYVKKRPGEGLNFSQRGQGRGDRGRTKCRPQGDNVTGLRGRFCMACRIVPPSGAYHCEECGVCIEGYDHHCPWTSKCIGKGNTKEFYTWILFTLLTIFYVGVAATLLKKNEVVDVGGGETREAVHTRTTFSP